MTKKIPWKLIISDLKNELAGDDQILLSQWLEKEENNALYLELTLLWDNIQQDAAQYSPDAEYYWKLLETQIDKQEKKKKKRTTIPLPTFRAALVAASVLLLISIFSSYFIGKKNAYTPVSSQTYTAINGKSQLFLPDGSLVWLNIGSTLVYETSFLKDRTVTLEGEALFEVKKDTEHPFTVSLDNTYIRVTGTRFNVQAYRSKPEIRVALLDGKISVWADNKEHEMFPGQLATYYKTSNKLSVAQGNVGFEAFWANKSCSFENKTLGYICKYLERWYNIKIVLDNSIAESHIYTFTITDEPLETILQIMSRINPVQYSFEENDVVIIKKR